MCEMYWYVLISSFRQKQLVFESNIFFCLFSSFFFFFNAKKSFYLLSKIEIKLKFTIGNKIVSNCRTSSTPPEETSCKIFYFEFELFLFISYIFVF